MNEEQATVEEKAKDPLEFIYALEGAPDKKQIDDWKVKFGAVYFSGFSEEEIFIWRAITRAEYKKLQIESQKIAEMKDQVEAANAQMTSEESIVAMCLLWPKKTVEELVADKGGTVPTLLEQIMQNSNFMSPQQASMLVVKL